MSSGKYVFFIHIVTYFVVWKSNNIPVPLAKWDRHINPLARCRLVSAISISKEILLLRVLIVNLSCRKSRISCDWQYGAMPMQKNKIKKMPNGYFIFIAKREHLRISRSKKIIEISFAW